jgi:3-carboxy-cis,cis-muconate cycloisomerase
MSSRLIDSLATTDALAEVFSDRSILQAMLDFEAALARAEAKTGVIPSRAAGAIAAAARVEDFDAAVIAREARECGTVSIPLVRALTVRVAAADAGSARFVHFGATSQDVADSAIVLTIARARATLAADHARLERTLRQLSDSHASTVMLGRTLLQPAPPITFGLKVAGWLAALGRGWRRVDSSIDEAAMLQFGGASGTLAALGDRGLAVSRALADDLGLRNPEAPWHTDRDRLAALVSACGVYTATLGKIARDISLLMQDEVGEVAERGGGSSTMPHKRNPAGCAVALAASTRLPGLVAAFLSGMAQEHERGVGGWHAEWPTLAATMQTTGSALAALADAVEGLSVHPDRMRANIEKTNGAIFAERAVMLMTPGMGKESALGLVSQALAQSRETGQSFREALMAMPEVARAIPAAVLATIDAPEDYVGAAEILRVRLLQTLELEGHRPEAGGQRPGSSPEPD